MKISGVVILYNPSNEVINNIQTYIHQIDKLYVIDNSNFSNGYLFDNLKYIEKIVYLPNYENLGVAKALNIGAKKAIEEGYEFLLTMDQDSSFDEDNLKSFFDKIDKLNNFGIISPYHVVGNKIIPKDNKIIDVDAVMTSGNILNLSAYKNVGGFLDELFIDYVDYEFCFRLKKNGYRILVDSSIILFHNLGNVKKKKFLFWDFYPTFHSATRMYYRTRNRFYVRKVFKKDFRKDLISFWKENIKIILFEDDKLEKITMIIRGYLDFKKGIKGKIKDYKN